MYIVVNFYEDETFAFDLKEDAENFITEYSEKGVSYVEDYIKVYDTSKLQFQQKRKGSKGKNTALVSLILNRIYKISDTDN